MSECGGGETVFYAEHNQAEETARIVPTIGSMLLHRHGVDCWQHEALPVALAGHKTRVFRHYEILCIVKY